MKLLPMRLVAAVFGTLWWPFLWAPQEALATEPVRVLIVDGVNNHDWPRATHALREILLETGRFVVDVATSPPADAPEEAWAQWRPPFEDYDVVVSNFNGGHKSDSLHWPVEVERALEDYVREGGGLVVFHSANNSFPNWAAYNRMIGLGWRNKDFGPSLIVDQEEHVLRLPAGEGRNPGHGPAHSFQITRLDPDHPITRGLPRRWMHPTEQLTHGQHGPAENVRVLTYAFSRDTKENEVVDWVVPFGKGRVFVTMQGHLWRDQTDANLRCVGFRTIFARGTEWAATGHVTSPVPKDFPTETETRVVEPSLGEEFDVASKKEDDGCTVRGSSDSATFSVTSPSGIGELTIRRTGPKWPEKIMLRLHLRGLEHLSIRNEDAALTFFLSIKSHSPHRVDLALSKAGTWSTVEPGTPGFTTIQAVDAAGREFYGIPLNDAYFQLEIPAAILKGNPEQLSIHWIDFHRS